MGTTTQNNVEEYCCRRTTTTTTMRGRIGGIEGEEAKSTSMMMQRRRRGVGCNGIVVVDDDADGTRWVVEEEWQEEEDIEMEELTTTAITSTNTIEHEDPDSRDSGISLTYSIKSNCSQKETLAITSSKKNENILQQKLIENIKQTKFDENHFYASSPVKKRLRGSETLFRGPIDFSSLRKQNNLSKSKEEDELEKQNTFTHQENCSHGVLQTSSSDSTIILASVHYNTSSSTDSNILPDVRSIHRVHSTSVLELSHDHSWGSPDALQHYSLVTVEKPQISHVAFRSIAPETLANLLESSTDEQFLQKFILVDCRYPYEFEGGHIRHSVNVWQPENLIDIFYPDDDEEFEQISQRIPIFYCEFSQKRGPKMAMALRQSDRSRNEYRYPYVDYQEIYLLDRGYRHFFKECKLVNYCSPESYVQMWDKAYADQRMHFHVQRRVKKRRRN